MRTHLTVRGVLFTAISRGAETSEWVAATVTVVEMRDPTAAPNTAHCEYYILSDIILALKYPTGGISIVPTSGTTQVVYLTGTDWTIHWEEVWHMFFYHYALVNILGIGCRYGDLPTRSTK